MISKEINVREHEMEYFQGGIRKTKKVLEMRATNNKKTHEIEGNGSIVLAITDLEEEGSVQVSLSTLGDVTIPGVVSCIRALVQALGEVPASVRAALVDMITEDLERGGIE